MGKIYDEHGEYTPEYAPIESEAVKIEKAEKEMAKVGMGANIEAVVGLCHSCDHFICVEDVDHQVVVSECDGFGYDRNYSIGKHKVKDCTQYRKRGTMDLQTMYTMATMLDSNAKPTIGF